MQSDARTITYDEAVSCRMICRLIMDNFCQIDLFSQIQSLETFLTFETDNHKALDVALTMEHKAAVKLVLTVFQLICHDKKDILERQYHLTVKELPEGQIQEGIAKINEYCKDHGVDLTELFRRLKEHRRTPVRKLYISDMHFFHNNLNVYMDHRGFADFEEMNRHMIRQWNDHVNAKDEVYILGDFSIARGKPTNEILKTLNGKKYLVEGNHDKFLSDKEFDRSLFEWIRPYAEIQDNRRKVILSHYPVFCYNGQYRTMPDGSPVTYMLYGHVHNTHDERLVDSFIRQTREARIKSERDETERVIPCNMINCFCMFSDYVPLTLDNWIRVDADRREKAQI